MAEHIEGPLYYERMGRSGPVMAFVHPNPMDQSCWIYQMAHLSTWFRCIGIDIPGYGRSPKEPWRPQFVFEDSPTCMNYDCKENPAPCSDCILMRWVPPESRDQKIPCRHISLGPTGETLDSLYRWGDQHEIEAAVRTWLRAAITKLEDSPKNLHGVKHFWLCERCCHVFTLVYENESGVVLRLLWPELPVSEPRKESAVTSLG